MEVRVVWNAGEVARVLAELPAGGPLPRRVVLVPQVPVAHVLRRELVRGGLPEALAGTSFVPFRIAAAAVLQAAGVEFVAGEETLRSVRLSALFRSDLPLEHFPIELLRSAPGWDHAFARTISDLEGAGLRPEELEPADALPPLRDLLTIWRALDRSAGASWTADRIYLEAALVLEGRPDGWPFPEPVLACAAGDLGAAAARFLRTLPRPTIILLAGRPARARHIERIERLLGAQAAAAVASANAPRADRSERDLLASYLFEPPAVLGDPARPKSPGPDGTVDLEEHAGIDAELEATADWVARRVADGVPLEEIAVLVPGSDPFVALVADRLGRLPWPDGAFPVYVADGLPLTHFAAGARLLALLRALRGHLAAGLLADLVPALRLADGSGRHLARGAAMDLLWSLGTVGGNPARPEGALEWSGRAAKRETELEKEIAEAEFRAKRGDEEVEFALPRNKRLLADLRALRPALDALIEISRSAIRGAPLSSLWPMLREFFERWLLQPGAASHAALGDRLDALARDEACRSVASDDALKVIEDAILGERVSVGRFGEPAVFVGTVKGTIGLAFTAVRVIGLHEGHLPSLPREDPVLPDAARQSLRRRDGGSALLPLARDRALADLHALDWAVRNAGRFVALSAPRLDLERSEHEPSSVMLEAAAALARPNRMTGERESVIPDRTALTRDAFVPAREETERFRVRLPLTESAWQDAVARSVTGIPTRWRDRPVLDLERIERLMNDSAAGPMDGIVGDLAAGLPMPGLSPDLPLSASAVAQLLRCPHAFLLERLLCFQEPFNPPPQREIGQPYYGSIFHEVAASFYAENGADFCARKKTLSHWQRVAERLVDRVFETFLGRYPLAGEGVRTQQRARLGRDVRDLLQRDWEQLKNARVIVEKSFGYPDAVSLPAGSETLWFHGRIDRIEIRGRKARIRDLKTARARPRTGKEAEPDPGLDLQIAVYAAVAEILAGKWNLPKQIEAGYAYFGRPGGERLFEDFPAVLKPAAARWLELAAALLRGRLFPRTPNRADCEVCSFRPVCGDQAQERARLLLGGATGTCRGFAALKGVDSGNGDTK
ncbi:MAG TPA: PD-(D/E)XK nuclease family protein [candidate division Zixibacteria bacterium]|nr:PD-(D/E)XK nuclease family protein [candidate division Zixibacteria bacterium]